MVVNQFTHTKPTSVGTTYKSVYDPHDHSIAISAELLNQDKICTIVGGVFSGICMSVILLQLCLYSYSTFQKQRQEIRERSRIIKERIHPVDYYYRKRIRHEFDSSFSLESSNGIDLSDLPTESNRQNKSYAEFFRNLEKNHLHEYKTYNEFVDDLENIYEYKTYNEFIKEIEKGSLSRPSSIESDYTYDLDRNDGYI